MDPINVDTLQAEVERLLTLVVTTLDPEQRRRAELLLAEARHLRDQADPPDPDPWLSRYFDA